MLGFDRLLRALASLALASLSACATTSPLEAAPETKESREDAELNRLLAELVSEREEEDRHRSARIEELRPLLDPPVKVPMPDEWRQRAVDLGELARLLYEAEELEASMSAVRLAVEAAIAAGDGPLVSGLGDFRVLVHRFVALELAKAGKFVEADRALSTLELAAGLTPEHRDDLRGLRKLVDEMRGVPSDTERAAKVQVAKSDILRTEGARERRRPREQRAPELERFDLSGGVFSAAAEARPQAPQSELAEAELPTLGGDSPATETGTLDQKTVLSVVTANRASVKACYSRAMKGTSIRGRLEVEAIVEPSGNVARAAILTTAFAETPIGECIRETLTRWKFPPFEGEEPRSVVLPFVLDTMGL